MFSLKFGTLVGGKVDKLHFHTYLLFFLLQGSTKYTPFELFFLRKPGKPGIINLCPMGDDFKVLDPEEHLEEKIHESVELNKKVKHETMNGDTILDVCNILHVTKVFLLFGRFSPTLRRHKNA